MHESRYGSAARRDWKDVARSALNAPAPLRWMRNTVPHGRSAMSELLKLAEAYYTVAEDVGERHASN